nr:hypothetical protein Itr_chr10CG17880 [Ipomoea trifida]
MDDAVVSHDDRSVSGFWPKFCDIHVSCQTLILNSEMEPGLSMSSYHIHFDPCLEHRTCMLCMLK